MLKTYSIKQEFHNPKYFILNAQNKTLGRLATMASLLLTGKYMTIYTPGMNLGNYVIILNADKIQLSGKKYIKKMYYKSSQTPGGLKKYSFKDQHTKFPTYGLKKAIKGMLPKNLLQKNYLKRLYIYSNKNSSQQIVFNTSILQAIKLST